MLQEFILIRERIGSEFPRPSIALQVRNRGLINTQFIILESAMGRSALCTWTDNRDIMYSGPLHFQITQILVT